MNGPILQRSHNGEVDPVLDDLLADFASRLENGEALDVEAYAAEHPDRAAELRRMLPAIQVLADLKSLTGGEDKAADGKPMPGLLGDFRLLREVGRGGMGIVYEAEQISLGRRVALKVLPFAATMDSRQLKRFQNEARAAAGLHHHNIVPVHFVGCERGVHYYAMQFIEGRDLASIVKSLRVRAGRETPQSQTTKAAVSKRRRAGSVSDRSGAGVNPPVAHAPGSPVSAPDSPTLPVAALSTERSRQSQAHYFRSVAKLGIQAAEALDYAHQQGIVHRDIKPANLLVDAEVRLWVTDFGLAQFQGDTGVTMTGDLVGTIRYMSPEQALAKRVVVDHRTDIYSLGATLFELLTLEPVFNGADRQEVLRQIAFEEPRAPLRINKFIPSELETIVLKSLEKNPADRYATARELAEDLHNFLENRPLRARRPSWYQRTRKWASRHRSLVAAAAVALLVTVAAMGASIGYVVRDQSARLSETALKITETLENARAAARKDDLVEARQLVAQARGYLGNNRALIPRAAAEIERTGRDIETISGAADLLEGISVAGRTLRMREAIPLYEQNVQQMKAKYGPEHAATLSRMRILANLYSGVGRHQDEIALRELMLERAKTIFGPRHTVVSVYLHNLGFAYGKAGRMKDSIALFKQSLFIDESTSRDDARITRGELAAVCEKVGRFEEAEPPRRQILADWQSKRGPQSYEASGALAALGSNLLKQKKYSEAERLFREWWEINQKYDLENDWHDFHHTSLLGDALMGQGKYVEAEPLLLRGYDGMLKREHRMNTSDKTRVIEARDRLVHLYEAWGKKAQADHWRAEEERLLQGFVHRWLVLSEPIPYSGWNGAKALAEETVVGEANLGPRAGDVVQVGPKRLAWKEHRTSVRFIDFETLYPAPPDYKMAYAVCDVHADEPRTDLVLRVGSDDQARVYLNGQEVYRSLIIRQWILDDDEVAITLKKGKNVLVFKVVNEALAWDGSIHILARDGSPAKGIQFGTEP